MRYPLLCLLALLTHLGAETLPPLKDGQVPQNLDALWGDFDPAKEPLEAEVTKEWEQDGIVCRVIRYRVGIFKGQPATVAAFYAFPKGATALPALMQIHGGGQSANLANAVTDAKRGYASLSLNWGGNKMTPDGKLYEGPNTDWGALDATDPPALLAVSRSTSDLPPLSDGRTKVAPVPTATSSSNHSVSMVIGAVPVQVPATLVSVASGST